jgi:hypothetical protein
MDDTLSEKLNLPKIGGEIKAFFEWNNFNLELMEKLGETLSLYQNSEDADKESYLIEYKNIYRSLTAKFETKTKEIVEEINNHINQDRTLRRLRMGWKIGSYRYWEILNRIYPDEPSKYYSATWELEFVFAGPDSRYLEGKTSFTPENVKELIIDFKNALEKMKALQLAEFSGSYKKEFGRLEIVAENQKIKLRFYVESKNQRYHKELNINEVVEIIEQLGLVEQKAIKLMQTLETLCF